MTEVQPGQPGAVRQPVQGERGEAVAGERQTVEVGQT